MNQHSPLFGRLSAPKSPYVCWTRMQAEAGQPLAAIVQRKELERQAGNGVFFWGVGNAPSNLIRPLAKTGLAVPVIFSVMKSAPKKADSDPTGTLAWTGYIDCDGVEREIPEHVLVTSRSETGSGPKRVHYALICRSDAPLQIRDELPFDHRSFRNAGTGGVVGASQVTALLQPTAEGQSAEAEYRQSLVAELTGSYWVKLTKPQVLGSGADSDRGNVLEYAHSAHGDRPLDDGGFPVTDLLL